MNTTPSEPAHHLCADVPEPILFNPWKHHAGFLRERIRAAGAAGTEGLRELAGMLVVISHELMDLYEGMLTPVELAGFVTEELHRLDKMDAERYRAWVVETGGFQILQHAEGSHWVLRLGDDGSRFVHVHPGRWAPLTRRVRANLLKTAVMVNA